MGNIRQRGELLRRFIVDHVERHPRDIARVAAQKYGVTRQAVNKHLQRLVEEGVLNRSGSTRSSEYVLRTDQIFSKVYPLGQGWTEDRVWREDIAPALGRLPDNVENIWHYGLTEMFNNAIDHSEGSQVAVSLIKSAAATQMFLSDNGVGIFRKIQRRLGLLDERHAVLELAKGKFTTDPANHTGEGIFFTSRAFDDFVIASGDVYFSHKFGDKEDWILKERSEGSGTLVGTRLGNHTSRTLRKIFDSFTSGDDYGFTKTVVPVRLAEYGDEALVSRSQAKRLLERVDRFRTVILDFKGVRAIGQAFADEVFRVFASQHPDLELFEMNTNESVKNMINRARANLQARAAQGT